MTSDKIFATIELDKSKNKGDFSMIILGIDPSTKSSGFAIFQDNELVHYAHTTGGSSAATDAG